MAGETLSPWWATSLRIPKCVIGSGATVASFTIASTPRNWNRNTNQFEDGQALFMRCSAWRDMAEHCAQSLKKGMRVIAQGRLQQRSYQAQDGSQRTVVEMQVDEIGPSLRYATAQVTRNRPVNGFQGSSAAIAAATTAWWQWQQWWLRRQCRWISGRLQRWRRLSGWGAPLQQCRSRQPVRSCLGPVGQCRITVPVPPRSVRGSSDFGGDSDEPEF